ncbi:hypothetical protein [Paenibacillus ginsengarvi]|uniref:hypothetical protein n=1 Tax=Paenibacillus ginsengarvi TaxID=400777 RepID=UPI0011C3E327|nr:hypothetical protein [Paenibacillus ginsengarvi]
MKKINMAIWGAGLLLLGFCLFAAATSKSGFAGAALAFASTLSVTASFLLNLSGLKRNMTNRRIWMFVIGFFFTVINTFVYMYFLIAGMTQVGEYSNNMGLLLFVFALILPAVLAFIFAVRGGLPSTKDRIGK